MKEGWTFFKQVFALTPASEHNFRMEAPDLPFKFEFRLSYDAQRMATVVHVAVLIQDEVLPVSKEAMEDMRARLLRNARDLRDMKEICEGNY